jgi:GntR family transcriptional repressor for pyruvate dehydrogenase complex
VTGSAVQLTPLRTPPLKEQVIHELVRLIEEGALEPGDRLPTERVLSEQLEVSRSTVREAVQFLQALGVVEIRHGSGSFVAAKGARSAELRREWRRWTQNHAGRVRDLLEVRADMLFHRALCDATGNAALVECAELIERQLVRERAASWDLDGRPQRSLGEHHDIHDAIAAGDSARARAAVLEHLRSVELDIARSLLGGEAVDNERNGEPQ